MRIVNLIGNKGVHLNIVAKDKDEVLNMLVDILDNKGVVKNRNRFFEEILQREALGSTAIESGIASPHAKSDEIKEPAIAVISLSTPLDFGERNGNLSDLFFMIATPTDNDEYLPIISRLMTLLLNDEVKDALKSAKTTEEFLSIIDMGETEIFNDEDTEKEEVAEAKGIEYRIVAITACPTGIAHTFMAAEALTKAGKELGVNIKVETKSTNWRRNILTEKEIQGAEAVIIASDISVDASRFDNKKIKYCSTSQAIKEPNKIIEEALIEENNVKEAIKPKQILFSAYRHIMTGVSYMMPFIIVGGLCVALSLMLGGTNDKQIVNHLASLPELLEAIGYSCLQLMFVVLGGFIAYSIGNKLGLVLGLVGSYLITNDFSLEKLSVVFPSALASGGFLTAIIIGFIAGYVSVGLQKISRRFPESLQTIFSTLICPFLGILIVSFIGISTMPFITKINSGISTMLLSLSGSHKIILGAVIGGMMSVDIGGPINKTAYLFSTAAMTNGNFEFIAASLLGGMIPPIATGISAIIFKNKWNSDTRKKSIVAIVLGLCFVTEGVIPFIIEAPFSILFSCIVGSATAGALSVFFKCGVLVPQGGIFAFPFVSNIQGYLIAFFTGIIVAVCLLGILKTKHKNI